MNGDRSTQSRSYIAYSNLFDELPDCGIDSNEIEKVTERLDFMTLTISRESFEDVILKAHEEETMPLLSKPSIQPLLKPSKQRKRSSIEKEAEDESVDVDKTPGKDITAKKRKAWFGPIQLFE